MAKFDFYGVGRIVFGRGQFGRVGELAAQLGRMALVVANGPDAAVAGLTDALTSAGVESLVVRQTGEPTVGAVDTAADAARRRGCDVVIGCGGGSAIDAAKAVAGLLSNGGSCLDYMEVIGLGRKITRPAAPWIAIPTTAGTGAEATRNAVIGCPEKQFKASLRSEHLLPRIALIDPELGTGVPPEVTARCGMDALCQCIEAYTSTGAEPMTDALALEGVGRAGRSLRRAFSDGSDMAAREDMALAALLSGIALTNAGLGAVHGFAAPLGVTFPVPHGTVCAALLPHAMAANVAALRAADAAHPALARYAAIGRALGARGEVPADAAIDHGMAFVVALCGALDIPPLRQFGMTEHDVPASVALARKSSSMRFNPIALSDEALQGILRAAL